jgi:ankyrin repeat protein
LAQLLLEHGAQLEALNAQQQTPLDVARLNKEVSVLQLYMKNYQL